MTAALATSISAEALTAAQAAMDSSQRPGVYAEADALEAALDVERPTWRTCGFPARVAAIHAVGDALKTAGVL